MPEEPDVLVHPRGLREEFPEGSPTAVITHRGCRLILRFAEGDFHGEGDVQEIRLLPDTATLQPRVLRQFAPEAETYLAYARAAMRIFNPDVPFETRQENLAGAVEALRQIAGPGRGLNNEFYRTIATSYQALVDGGEPHPIKALGEKNHVTISAASRWVKEARRRGFIKGGEKDAR